MGRMEVKFLTFRQQLINGRTKSCSKKDNKKINHIEIALHKWCRRVKKKFLY